MSPYSDDRTTRALTALRIALACFLFIHGSTRTLQGTVPDLADFFRESHVPAPLLSAWVLTGMELVGTVVFAAGFLVTPLALWFSVELAMGILMVHRHAGWFVVGGGRNGMEYSVLLICGFLVQGWAASGGFRLGRTARIEGAVAAD